MADNKQNSEAKNTEPATDNKTTSGGAASTRQAKEENSAPENADSQKTAGAAKDPIDKAKDVSGHLVDAALGQVKEKAGSVIDEQKTNLASGINTVADSIRQITDNLGGDDDKNQIAAIAGKYGDTLAGQVEKFSSYIEDAELTELVGDVEKFARRNPILFVGGAFALGVLAARFLKSSARKSKRGSRNG